MAGKVGGLDGGSDDTGEVASGVLDAPRQGVGVATRSAADEGAEADGGLSLFERDEVGPVTHVDARRREIGRDEALLTVAAKDDQVAQLGQGAGMTLGDVAPAAAGLPGWPLRMIA